MKDRSDASALEDNAHLPDLEGADVSEVLPSDDDLRILKQNMSVIAGKCIHYSCHCILVKFLCRKDYSEVLSVFLERMLNQFPPTSHTLSQSKWLRNQKWYVNCAFDNFH